MGKHREAPQHVLDDLAVVRRIGPVLSAGQEVLNALDVVASAVNHGTHVDLRLVHVVIEDLALALVGDGLADARGLSLLEGHGLAYVVVVEGRHHVRVEAQHIAVTDAVGDAVAVQALAEYHGGGGAFLLVLVEDRRARETEEQRVWESPAYVLEHVAEG